MKKLLILFILIAAYGCGFVIQSLPNMIVRGEGTTLSMPELGIIKNIQRKEETVRNSGTFKIRLANGELDSTFVIQLYPDSCVILDVTSSSITKEITAR